LCLLLVVERAHRLSVLATVLVPAEYKDQYQEQDQSQVLDQGRDKNNTDKHNDSGKANSQNDNAEDDNEDTDHGQDKEVALLITAGRDKLCRCWVRHLFVSVSDRLCLPLCQCMHGCYLAFALCCVVLPLPFLDLSSSCLVSCLFKSCLVWFGLIDIFGLVLCVALSFVIRAFLSAPMMQRWLSGECSLLCRIVPCQSCFIQACPFSFIWLSPYLVPIMSCVVLCCHVVSCLVLSCLAFSLSSLSLLSCLVSFRLSCLALSCVVMCYLVLWCLALCCLALCCLVLCCLVLCCLIFVV
jgi:hypothetical protein